MKKQWVVPEGEIFICELTGEEYVRLEARNASLRSLLLADNPNAPTPRPKGLSITSNQGLRELQKLRNEAQAKELLNTNNTDSCILFAGAAGETSSPSSDAGQGDGPTGSTRMSPQCARCEIPAKRIEFLNKSALDVTVCVNGKEKIIRVARPLFRKDKLYILYEKRNVATVVAFLRASAYTAGVYTPRNSALPKGVWKRSDGFVVRGPVTGKYRKVETVENAQDFFTIDLAAEECSDHDDNACIEDESDACDEQPQQADGDALNGGNVAVGGQSVNPSLVPAIAL